MIIDKFIKILILITFSLVSLNSVLKIFYYSNIWNFFSLFCSVLCSIFILYRYGVRKIFIPFLLIGMLFFLFVISFTFDCSILDEESLQKFIVLLILIQFGYFSIKWLDIVIYHKVVLSVCFFSLIYYFLFPVNFFLNNTNYLMLTTVLCYGYVLYLWTLYEKITIFKVLFLLFFIFIISILQSRSSILLSFIFSFLVVSDIIRIKMGWRFLSFLCVIVLSTVYISYLNLSFILNHLTDLDIGYGFHKLIGMINGNYSDDRVEIYSHAFNLFLDNPFGYGFGSHIKLLGYYPHNLFLEIGLNFGFIYLFVYLFFVVVSIYLYCVCGYNVKLIALSFLYFLCVWMFSFDYFSSFQVNLFSGAVVYCFFNIKDFKDVKYKTDKEDF